MPIDREDKQLPSGALDDINYVRANFLAPSSSRQALIEAGILPQSTYVLPDGTPMVPPDHGALLDDVGGDERAVADEFRVRFLDAGGSPDDLDNAFEGWMSGIYGACLHSATPEVIVAKGALMTAISALTARPNPHDPTWCGALRGAVDALDALERPFAEFDRQRSGGSVSRDRLITAPRSRFHEIWKR